MEVLGKRGLKDEDDIVCQLCEDLSVYTRSDGFCMQCEEHMCKTCFQTHKQFKLNREHTLANTNEPIVTKEQSDDLEKCKQHFNELVKFYCPEHDQVGCSDCMVLEHKTCKVEYIRDIGRTFKDSRKFQDLIKGAEKCHEQAKEIAASIQNNKIQARDINDKFVQDVQMYSDDIISQIKKLKNIAQAEAVKSKDIENMENIEKENEELMKEITRLTELFESQIHKPNRLFVSYVLQTPKLKRLQETQASIKKKNSFQNYQFKPNDELKRLVKETKVLGNLQKTNPGKDETDVKSQPEPVPSPNLPKGLEKRTDGTSQRDPASIKERKVTVHGLSINTLDLLHNDGTTQWNPPNIQDAKSKPEPAPSTNLPKGWEKRLDYHTNEYYYVNHNHKTTQWNLPNIKDVQGATQKSTAQNVQLMTPNKTQSLQDNIVVRKKTTDQALKVAAPLKMAARQKSQPLKERQKFCRNIEVDGEYLSYADNGSGDVGLYVFEGNYHSDYIEIEIISTGQRGTIALGYIPRGYPENHQPGWGERSVGYHADDGKLYHESGSGTDFGPKCNAGDRMGCSLLRNLFGYYIAIFTRNGKEVGVHRLGIDFYLPTLYPAIGLHSTGEKVKVIFDAKKPWL